jgi:hypothetical protein
MENDNKGKNNRLRDISARCIERWWPLRDTEAFALNLFKVRACVGRTGK